jgi:hypothetical protein
MKTNPVNATPTEAQNGPKPARSPRAGKRDDGYSDLLLVDLLHPDWQHFFIRYRTDLLGLMVIVGIILMMILSLALLARWGA